MPTKTIQYTASSTLRKFHQSDSPLRVIIGPTKSGSTTAALVELFTRCREQEPDDTKTRRSRWAVVASSIAVLRSDQIPVWMEIVPEGTFGQLDGTTHHIKYQLPDDTVVDAEVVFTGASTEAEAARLGALKLTGVVLSGEGINDIALDTLRSTIGLYPPNPTYTGVIVESVYPEDGTWLEQLLHKPPPGCELFQQPAGDSPGAENLASLPSGYYQRLVETNKPDWVARYVRATSPPLKRLMSDIELCHRLGYSRREADKRGLTHEQMMEEYPELKLVEEICAQ
jgi:hypothetical protein